MSSIVCCYSDFLELICAFHPQTGLIFHFLMENVVTPKRTQALLAESIPRATQPVTPALGGGKGRNSKKWLIGGAILCLSVGYSVGMLQWTLTEKTKAKPKLVDIADKATPLKAGPWGNMESIPIFIEPSEEYLPIKAVENSSRDWKFDGYSEPLLSALFSMADLSGKQKAELTDRRNWKITEKGITVTPSEETVMSLSPRSRKLIYNVLFKIPGNAICSNRVYFPADRFDEYFASSGLSPDIVAMVKSLSYPHGKLLFFGDAPLVMEKLPSYQDKVKFLKAMERKPTLLLRLHITQDSDVAALANYWSKAAWGKDIKPMLESLAKVPGGARIGLGQLLPPMPTSSLYTFPFPSLNPADLNKDCHWTAFNFFRDPPDPRYTNVEFLKHSQDNDYYPVLSDPRYGDIVQLMRPTGETIHSAVFIADNIVYTKNSAQPMEPFMLMTMQDMLDTFASQVPEGETLQVMVYRSKYY